MAKRHSNRAGNLGTLIGLIIVAFVFIWVFRSLIISWLVSLFNAMITGLISFFIGLGELLLLGVLPLFLGYLAGNKLLEKPNITSGWGIVSCVIFLFLFSYISLGLLGVFIGLIVWGILIAFGIDKLKQSGMF